MAKIRRTIRKTKQPGEAAFDEQFWPVMLALFVLAGFLVGTVLAYLHFDTRPWYSNAWTWLFVIPIVVCALIWLLRKVESRAVRRGVQFSAVLCVIVHLILFIVSIETNIFGRVWAEFTELADTRVAPDPLVPIGIATKPAARPSPACRDRNSRHGNGAAGTRTAGTRTTDRASADTHARA
jgi:hypothetical protein